MKIKYYKVTSDQLNAPVYYAGYDLNNVKNFAYSDFNSQFPLQFEKVKLNDIPTDEIITSVDLELEDAQLVSNRSCLRIG